MMFKFTKKITCPPSNKEKEDPIKCSNDIMDKLETKFGFKIHGDKPEGHISINHEKDNHAFWIFLYDKTGEHESQNTVTKEIIKQKSSKAKKFTGTIPTESELKKAI